LLIDASLHKLIDEALINIGVASTSAPFEVLLALDGVLGLLVPTPLLRLFALFGAGYRLFMFYLLEPPPGLLNAAAWGR